MPSALLEAPADRLTEDRVIQYVDELDQTISPRSVWSYISKLHNMAYCIFPGYDWLWLREIVNLLHETLPSDAVDETKLVGIDEIYKLGFDIMAEAVGGKVKRSHIAPHYRNGLLLALGAETLLRPGNLSRLVIGRHLVKPLSRWQVVIPAEEVKNSKRVERTLSERLSKAIDGYLDVYHPQMLAGRSSDHMWINHLGQDMKPHAVAQRVVKVTTRRLGKAVSIQRFRNCAATSIAVHNPELVGITPTLLAHWNEVTYQRHYNRAGQATALSRFHQVMNELKEDDPSCAP
ncbi:MAG: hypothetical protein P8Q36_15255 [Alphaproteobacteria bacterium]|nr:hypothetical protein [Rhodospirillaceae bacterium]MDG2482204.1 hypothetical protein [Alphaproteobacteria bacterium]